SQHIKLHSFPTRRSSDLLNQGFRIIDKDDARPWGGFFVLHEADAEKFISVYFPHLSKADLQISSKLSPKFLLVAPKKRLSWQYQDRKSTRLNSSHVKISY